MCGLVGFSGEEPEWAMVEALAEAAGRRGPHGWGAAWIYEGAVRTAHGAGPLGRAVPYPLLSSDQGFAGPFLLHARLATSGVEGDQSIAAGGQPIVIDGLAVAHNGTVAAYEELIAGLGATPTTSIDSEVIALLVAAFVAEHLPLDTALGTALAAAAPLAPAAALLLDQRGFVVAARRPGVAGPGHPLWALQRPEGVYVCSRRPGPGWREVADGATIILPRPQAA